MSALPDDELDELDRFLIGKSLKGGWTIVEVRHVQRDHPSSCRTYRAENRAGASAFVKILDNHGTTELDAARLELERFIYERDIIDKCAHRNMRRVVQGLAYGYLQVPGIVPLYLHYLIFEWAESDIRSRPELEGALHHAHALRWLHHATTAIEELHYSEISHQDVKPANLLVRAPFDAKLGDLGRAVDGGARRPDLEAISDKTRDRTYAPPEVLYGNTLSSLETRFSSDLYQLGAIAVYLFTGAGMTSQLMRDIPPIHHWTTWRGSYADVLPYLAPQFEAAIARFSSSVDDIVREALIVAVRQLCDPNPTMRGLPTHKLGGQPRYTLRPYVSLFNRLAYQAEHSLRRSGS